MKWWMLIFLVVFSISCQDIEKVERPENLIAENKLVEVLTDLSLMLSSKNYNRPLLEQTGFRPEEFLYEKHNIDSLSLAASTKFYAQDPANMERIYTKVKRNLEALKTDLEVIREEEVRVEDSLQAVIREGDSLRIKNDSLATRNSLVPVPKRPGDTLKAVPKMRRNGIQP